MPLPSSGSISLSQVNVELGRSATATISLGESAVRTLFGKASGAISMSDGYGKANQFAFTISANQTNADLRTLAINAGWNQSSKVVATISSGVYISSNSTGTAALTVSGSFPGGVELVNNGFIIGMGGNGGRGREADLTDGTGGSAGGLALLAQVAVSINNVGTIAGGGGGGGGGGAGSYTEKAVVFSPGGGGGGGGRTGTTNSSGGAGGRSSTGGSPTTPYATAGGAGTSSSAGAGGARANYSPGGYVGGAGGAGGGWGVAGATGVSGTTSFANSTSWAQRRFGLSGGSAGGSITGVSNITWIATGTRLGPII